MRILSFLICAILQAQSVPVWTNPGYSGTPPYNGYLADRYDPVSSKVLHYGASNGSTSIYSSDFYFCDPLTTVCSHWGGTGGSTDAAVCAFSDTASLPGGRHPVAQHAVDTLRNVWWMGMGVCSGTARLDLYYLSLNANYALDTFTKVTPTTSPNGATSFISAAWIYDPDDDVIFAYGSDSGPQTRDNWLYCPTIMTGHVGTLTAAQIVAGCAAADDWSLVCPGGTLSGGNCSGITQPVAVGFPGLIYDTAQKKAILFGGVDSSGATSQNQTWWYDVPTKVWTNKAPSNPPPAPANNSGGSFGQPALARVPSSGLIYYLFARWLLGGSNSVWTYNPATNTWTQIDTGTGPQNSDSMVYDVAANALIAHAKNQGSGALEIWTGQFQSGGTTSGQVTISGKVTQ